MSTARLDDDFWTDPKIEQLKPEEKLLFVWFFTNPYRNWIGLYKLPKPMIKEHTGLSDTSIDRGIDTLIHMGLISYNSDFKMVFVKSMLKRQMSQNEGQEKLSKSQYKGIINQLSSLHNCPLIQEFLAKYSYLNISYEYTPTDTPTDTSMYINPQPQPNPQPNPQPEHTCASPTACGSKKTNGFELFWEAYPKKKNKPKALKAWNTAQSAKDFPGIEKVLSAINQQKTEIDWIKENGQFIPYPSTWINAQGWNNEPTKIESISQRTATNLRNAWEFANES